MSLFRGLAVGVKAPGVEVLPVFEEVRRHCGLSVLTRKTAYEESERQIKRLCNVQYINLLMGIKVLLKGN